MNNISIAWLDITAVAPLIVLTLGALVVLLLEVFMNKNCPRVAITGFCLVLAFVALIKYGIIFKPEASYFSGLVFADPFQAFFIALTIFGTFLVLLIGKDSMQSQGIEAPGEYYSLLLMTSAGALVFVGATEFINFFLGLEIMSMALYALCGASLGRAPSAESALKYFLLGSFSSAFMLYGIAIVYGLVGSMSFNEIANSAPQVMSPLFLAGMGLIIFGLVFKLGLVPFHFWAPDVYQGAPTPVTAFMAGVIKAVAVGATIRVMWGCFGTVISHWSGIVWIMSLLTMVIGNLVALRQRNIKRMLAYSSIAHAGYIAMAFLAPEHAGGSAIIYYLVAYLLMTIGAFAVLLSFTSEESAGQDITSFNGFSQKNPLLAGLMALFMLSMAGIPPGLAGLLGKVYLLNSVIQAGYLGLAIVAVLSAAVGCYYYLRIIVAMYFIDADSSTPTLNISGTMLAVLLFCASGVVFLGIFPSLLFDSSAWIMHGILAVK